jgi:hypothetical protein
VLDAFIYSGFELNENDKQTREQFHAFSLVFFLAPWLPYFAIKIHIETKLCCLTVVVFNFFHSLTR